MMTFQNWKKLFKSPLKFILSGLEEIHSVSKFKQLNVTNFFSLFFYYFSRLLVVSKIKENGRIIASTYDVVAVIAAWFLAYGALIEIMGDMSVSSLDKTNNSILYISTYWKPILIHLVYLLPLQCMLFRFFGLYRGFWRFASIQDLRKILYVSILGSFFSWIIRMNTNDIFLVSHSAYVKSSFFILLPSYITTLLYGIFLAAFLSSARLAVRFAKNYKHLYSDFQRVIIIGAGNAGEGLVRDLLRDETHRFKPIAFLDDDLAKLGREIHNIRVVGPIIDLPLFIKKYEIDLVLIAIPSASSASMRSVLQVCEEAKVRCSTLPGIKDLADGHVNINKLRSISLEDLLGRNPVSCQWSSIKTLLKNKTILVTGGGGSIGSELCRQMALLGNITRLIIVDSNEYNLYSIDMELRLRFPSYSLQAELLSVTDRVGIQSILKKYQPDIVFHAAAYKHVPLLENQPRVAIYNNIIGTSIIAEESMKANVETFVLISSDKAVNPTNIMGATKRAAEYFCQNCQDESKKTRFITVRFGNVLDSAGSVIPLFRKQIETGGPVTVTHPDITRYFMTIPEASQLILQAAFLGQGCEIFVLDMGDPIKIRYLAEQMIKLAGKTVDKDIKIIYTGLRPGEKLYEECFYSNETLQPTLNVKILMAKSQKRHFREIKNLRDKMLIHCEDYKTNQTALLQLLKQLVPEYKDSFETMDTTVV